MPFQAITPATTALPATGIAADVDTIEEDFLNFAPVASQTITAVKTAATAPAVNGFHRFLNILMAASIATQSIPAADVQAIGGIVGIAAAILNITVPDTPATPAAQTETIVHPPETAAAPAVDVSTIAPAPAANVAVTPAPTANAVQAPAAVPAPAMATATAHVTAGQRALEFITFGAVKPHPAVVAAQQALATAMAQMKAVATQS